jgi:hypothetical protein
MKQTGVSYHLAACTYQMITVAVTHMRKWKVCEPVNLSMTSLLTKHVTATLACVMGSFAGEWFSKFSDLTLLSKI